MQILRWKYSNFQRQINITLAGVAISNLKRKKEIVNCGGILELDNV